LRKKPECDGPPVSAPLVVLIVQLINPRDVLTIGVVADQPLVRWRAGDCFHQTLVRVREQLHSNLPIFMSVRPVAGLSGTASTSWPTGAALFSCRREEFAVDQRLEGGEERIPGVDCSIEAGVAKLNGAYKGNRPRRGSVRKRKVGMLIALSDK
jgi:hypothetical protein